MTYKPTPINMVSPKGNIVKRFSSLHEAAEYAATNMSAINRRAAEANISSVVNGKSITAYGYQWKRSQEIPDTEPVKQEEKPEFKKWDWVTVWNDATEVSVTGELILVEPRTSRRYVVYVPDGKKLFSGKYIAAALRDYEGKYTITFDITKECVSSQIEKIEAEFGVRIVPLSD